MRKRIPNVCRFFGRLGFALVVLGIALATTSSAGPTKTNMPNGSYWIENTGQWEGDFQYKCEVGNDAYYVTPKGMTVDFREFHRYPKARDSRDLMDRFDQDSERDSVTVSGHVVQIHYVGVESKLASGEGLLSHYSNYFLGRDSTTWRSRVPHYQTVIAEEVWPGINVEYRADTKGVETIYHVQPGADPTQIQIDYIGIDAPLRTDAQGNLILATSLGDVNEKAPYAFQNDGRTQKTVPSRYRILDCNRVAFEFDGFDVSKELVVDPLLYGTFWGGHGPDRAEGVDVAPDGAVAVCGTTQADNFPTTPGAYQETFNPGPSQGFISLFSPSGDTLIFSTYIASSGGATTLLRIEATSFGIWAGGYTSSTNFPTTPDALQSEFHGVVDGLLNSISNDGTDLTYATYIGGAFSEGLLVLVETEENKLLVGGGTSSLDFPTTPDALFPDADPNQGDGFFCVFDLATRTLEYSSYIAGNGDESTNWICDIGSGDILMNLSYTYSTNLPITPNAAISTNQGDIDGYILCWNYLTNTIHYATYLGGSTGDYVGFLAFDESSHIVAGGGTQSIDFPVTTNAFDTSLTDIYWATTVTVIDTQSGIIASTLLEGGDYHDYLDGMLVGSRGITLVGEANSFDFPVTPNADDTLFNANGEPSWFGGDIFVARLSSDLSTLVYSTFLGGDGIEQWLNAYFVNENDVWIVGNTGSADFPTTENAVQPQPGGIGDGFLLHYELPDTTNASSRHRSVDPDVLDLKVAPNPLNSATSISFSLPRHLTVSLDLVNVLGQTVRSIDIGTKSAGIHWFTIDMSELPSGYYTLILHAESISESTPIILLR